MELHQLRYFCAVAETGSFSRAAEQSHVAQPSLSQQIAKLENELGARLFDRLGRSVRLTDLGKTFLPRARAVLRELEAARGDVVERKDSVAGPLVVGVIPTIAPYFLPPQLTAFTRQFPQARAHRRGRNHAGAARSPARRQSLTSRSSRYQSAATNSTPFRCLPSACSPCCPRNTRSRAAVHSR